MTLCSKLSDSYTSFRWVIYEHRARSRARGRCHLRIGLLNLWRILSGSAAGGNIPLGSEWPSPPITCFHAWIELRHWLRFRPFFNCVVLPWWLGSIRSNSEATVWYNTWIRREVWGLLVGTGGGRKEGEEMFGLHLRNQSNGRLLESSGYIPSMGSIWIVHGSREQAISWGFSSAFSGTVGGKRRRQRIFVFNSDQRSRRDLLSSFRQLFTDGFVRSKFSSMRIRSANNLNGISTTMERASVLHTPTTSASLHCGRIWFAVVCHR